MVLEVLQPEDRLRLNRKIRPCNIVVIVVRGPVSVSIVQPGAGSGR